jgi:hypothetical protein
VSRGLAAGASREKPTIFSYLARSSEGVGNSATGLGAVVSPVERSNSTNMWPLLEKTN